MGRRMKRPSAEKTAIVPGRGTAGDNAVENQGRTETVLFAVTLFVSAVLLFAIEPMFAKMVLPLLGGAPAVWNTCLVFYQTVLLAGYLYAHVSVKWIGPRRQAALHLIVMCLPWMVLPLRVAQGWIPPPDAFPVTWLWILLSLSVGLPFLVVSASAPLLQAWFAQTKSASSRDPYFLYAASNLGSLLALLGYPLVIEANLTITAQNLWWAAGYGLLMMLVAGCAARLWLSSPAGMTAERPIARADRTTQETGRCLSSLPTSTSNSTRPP